MKDRIICFAICFILAFEPIPAYALDPVSTTISVVGGTMGTEGLAAIGATGPVALAAVGVTVAVMAGLHLDSKISQASANAGMTKTQYISTKIKDYCTATGQTIGDYSKAILETVKISRQGLIYMGVDACNAFQDLFDWLDNSGSIQLGDNVVAGDTVNGQLYTDSYTVNFWYGASETWQFSTKVGLVALLFQNRSDHLNDLVVLAYNTSPFYYNNNISARDTYGGYNYVYFGDYNSKYASDFAGMNVLDYSTAGSKNNAIREYLGSLNGAYDVVSTPNDYISAEQPWEQVKAEIQPDEGEAVVVDPHAIGAIADSYPAVGDLNISVGDYLDALRKAWDGAIADTIPAVDALTGEEVAIPIPQDLVDSIPADTTVDIVNEETIDDTTNTPVIDDTIPPSPTDALQGMSVGLDDIFPFCIPFDIYHILQKFNASPETPVVDLNFNSAIIGVSIPLHIDLHQFDGVAQVARTMELVAYVVGLAIITRKTILRG